MVLFEANYFAVFVSAVVVFVIGFLWYGPVFGKIWMREMKLTDKDKKRAQEQGMGKQMFLNFIGNLVMVYVLAYFVFVFGISTILGAVQLGFLVWIGFFAATTLLGGVLWENKSWALYFFNATYWLVNLIVVSAILAVW